MHCSHQLSAELLSPAMVEVMNFSLLDVPARTVVLEPGAGITPCDLNLLHCYNFFKLYRQIIHFIRCSANVEITIQIKDSYPNFFMYIMELKDINSFPITPYLPTEYHLQRCLIKHPEIKYLSGKDILQLLKEQRVISVYKKDDQPFCYIGWPMGISVPDTIILGWDRVKVILPEPQPV